MSNIPTFRIRDSEGNSTDHEAVHIVYVRELERENARLREGFAPSIHAIEINARANEEAASRATESRDIAWSQGVAAGLRLALSYLPNVQAQR